MLTLLLCMLKKITLYEKERLLYMINITLYVKPYMIHKNYFICDI